MTIQINSIIYLHANLTAQRPVIKWARIRKRNETHIQIQKQGNLYHLNNNSHSIEFFIYYVLNSTAYGQLQSQHEYKQQQ
jgi:hypothetical protein